MRIPREASNSARAGPTPFRYLTSVVNCSWKDGIGTWCSYYNESGGIGAVCKLFHVEPAATTEFTLLHAHLLAVTEDMGRRSARWLKYLIAIIVGNLVYFVIERYLPPAAQHHSFRPDLGTVVDLWVCVAVYGLLEFVTNRFKRKQKI